MRPVLLVASLLLLAGCPGAPPTSDAGTDAAAAPDTLARDDGTAMDAVAPDALASDAAAPDTTPDAAAPDGAAPDGAADARADVATPDAPPADASDAAATCSASEVTSRLAGLLFTSESDYPITFASFAGEGAAPPTPDQVRRLSSATAGARTEARDVSWFWARVVVDPTRMPPAPAGQIAELRARFDALASDQIVVRVIEPGAPAEVRVYLAGRTACGAVVWLHSTAIET